MQMKIFEHKQFHLQASADTVTDIDRNIEIHCIKQIRGIFGLKLIVKKWLFALFNPIHTGLFWVFQTGGGGADSAPTPPPPSPPP